MARKLFLIDGYAQIFRAFYAIRSGMNSPVTGEPTHAVFGFTSMLHKIFTQLKPDFLAVAMDGPGPTFRDEMYPEYKATRPPMPEELAPQIPRIMDLLQAYNVPLLSAAGYEADDVIATVVRRVLEDEGLSDIEIYIVSRDKDLEQLICDRVKLYDAHKDEIVDEAALMAEKGIRPDQVIDLLALTGDTADNVPGVKGIGAKTAAQLLQQFGSLDGILANLDQIKGKRRENLEAAKEQLPLSRALVTLRSDADIRFDLEEATLGPIDLDAVLRLFRELGFRRHQEEVRKVAEEFGAARAERGPLVGGADAREEDGAETTDTASPAVERGRYELILTPERLAEVVATLKEQELICLDTETTGLDSGAELCGISFAWRPGHGVYIPVLSQDPASHLDLETVAQQLKPVLEDPVIPKCGHNVKFDTRVLLRSGIKLRGIVFDTMLASQLLDPSRPSHRLDDLVHDLLGYRMTPISQLIGDGDAQCSMAEVNLEQVAEYAAEDADMTLRLQQYLAPQIEAHGMTELLTKVEAPLAGVLGEMEETGVLCHPEILAEQEEALVAQIEELKERIFAIAGIEFNLDSPKQLAEVLFDRLGFKPVKKTKTGVSTDVEVMTQLSHGERPDDPVSSIPRLILEYRQLNKLVSTYMGNLRDAINPRTGRIHSTFHQLVTATGRLASQDPNLQNIPVRSDIGRQIRKAFTAPPGHLLLCADYSQIELRILAHLSEDPGLLEAFRNDDDIHAAVASRVFGVPIDQVTPNQRSYAKTINFGIIYGITAYGLSRRIPDLDVKEAASLIEDYKTRFPGIERFLQECVSQAEQYGYVSTMLGRRRYIPEIRSSNRSRKAQGERFAINTVVQGSAADLIKLAMVNLQRRIDEERLPLKLVLQIHDELVFEVAEGAAEEAGRIVKEEMEGAMELHVPLKAEIATGPNWMDAK